MLTVDAYVLAKKKENNKNNNSKTVILRYYYYIIQYIVSFSYQNRKAIYIPVLIDLL